MRTNRLTLPALIACAGLTVSCAGAIPTSSDATPPQLELPKTARKHCPITLVPANPSLSDLELVAEARGREVGNCDDARQLAVDTHDREHAGEAAWAKDKAARRRPRWKVW